jgi:hypothetical protein
MKDTNISRGFYTEIANSMNLKYRYLNEERVATFGEIPNVELSS